MRVLKDDKYNAILQAARNEFFTKGFKEASMRVIAKEAKVGLSNIYNYFSSKDELFVAVVKPAKDTIYNFIRRQHTEDNIDVKRLVSFRYQDEVIEEYIGIIDKYRNELRLLFFYAEGSLLKDFRDTLTDYITQVSIDHMKVMKKHYPHVNDLSDFFIHALSSWMVTIVGEIISHNLDKPRIRDFFKEYFRFEIAGWREIVGV
ncbi:TetR/AcrR family transcriptional regulator [Massilibacteroides sp.]|uniref:TetR/AcrR family transcriptional regulator n=1 Tax=Massilibacteroides sp. TaxID=2034766 RepID=UPI00262F8180|nr:TetR/AcrR family transcriptional regulator [Massilibacteroides sp.]MDD4516133.1 TetR/AcrR family transcriptional regulator [Massilibacteroides sp.]